MQTSLVCASNQPTFCCGSEAVALAVNWGRIKLTGRATINRLSDAAQWRWWRQRKLPGGKTATAMKERQQGGNNQLAVYCCAETATGSLRYEKGNI